jgi:thioredoxin 1
VRFKNFKFAVTLFCLSTMFLFARQATLFAAAPMVVPIKEMVTMVDLGATECIPCKMMAPILEKLKKEYAGRVALIFLDVKKDPSLIKRYGISAIPTQIFFDKDGKGVLRHRGFMSEKAIVEQFKKMGIN